LKLATGVQELPGGPMKRLLSLLATFPVLYCTAQVASGQGFVKVSRIQTGFAVVTPLNPSAPLNVSEILGQEVRGNLFRSSVVPSPLVTLTSLVTVTNPKAGVDTGVAIVNPNDMPTTVLLTLNNQQGVALGVRRVTIPGLQQISRFVTQLFIGDPELQNPFSGQLFISSDIPIAVMGLSFAGPSFTSLPVATQVGSVLTRTVGVNIDGTGAQLLPQVVAGGGWMSTITIANSSNFSQIVRVDLFASQGGLFESSNGPSSPLILVPARGVFTITVN
jgi:hypothetical protein